MSGGIYTFTHIHLYPHASHITFIQSGEFLLPALMVAAPWYLTITYAIFLAVSVIIHYDSILALTILY